MSTSADNQQAVAPVGEGFVPNFTVQESGTTTWAEPGTPPVVLDPHLPVQVLEWREGWALVACSNGWEAWVDGRTLVRIEAPPEPEPVDELTLELTDAVARYREAAGQASAGAISPDEFRRQAFTIGHVVKDDVAYLFDAVNQQWTRYDGTALTPMT